MRIPSRRESRIYASSVGQPALDRIREWTDAAEMDADEESIRLLAEAARVAPVVPEQRAA